MTKQAAVNLAARELVSHMLSLVPFFQPGPQLKKCPTCGLGWYPKKMLDLAPDLTFKLLAALDELEQEGKTCMHAMKAWREMRHWTCLSCGKKGDTGEPK